jgi:hypothetical protein
MQCNLFESDAFARAMDGARMTFKSPGTQQKIQLFCLKVPSSFVRFPRLTDSLENPTKSASSFVHTRVLRTRDLIALAVPDREMRRV